MVLILLLWNTHRFVEFYPMSLIYVYVCLHMYTHTTERSGKAQRPREMLFKNFIRSWNFEHYVIVVFDLYDKLNKYFVLYNIYDFSTWRGKAHYIWQSSKYFGEIWKLSNSKFHGNGLWFHCLVLMGPWGIYSFI